MIGPEHLAAALAFWDYCERSAPFIFGESTGKRHADILWRWLREDSEIPWAEAKGAPGLRTAADMQEAVDLLVGLDVAELITRPRLTGPGRPTRVIRAKDAKNPMPARELERGS